MKYLQSGFETASNLIENRRAIQIGIGSEFVPKYVNSWIFGLEDVTSIAQNIAKDLKGGKDVQSLEHPFEEMEFSVEANIMTRIGMLEIHSRPKNNLHSGPIISSIV